MRIIGGQLKGRRFHPPANKWPTRPTTDFAKEGLYNILQNRINFEDIIFLDLFGGIGNHTLEFVSRGCTDATYVEKHRGCIGFVKRVMDEVNLHDFITIAPINVFTFLEKTDKKFDIIFCDPPYAHKKMNEIPELVFSKGLLSEKGILIVEHDKTTSFAKSKYYREERKYGGSIFSFFEH